MTFSDLISDTVPHHNKFWPRKGQTIDRMIQHHHAATSDAGLVRLMDPSAQASASYIIMNDGKIYGQVPEEYGPWTSGGSIDESSVTIEVQNSSGQVYGNDNDPLSWQVSDAALNSIILLTADVGRRNGWAAIDENTYQGHRLYQQTACPGGYLWSKMGDIRSGANFFLSGVAQNFTLDEKFFLDLSIPLP